MAVNSTIKIALKPRRKNGKARTKSVIGKVAWLDLGGSKHKFFIHDKTLTDWRSGGRVRDLRAVGFISRLELSDRDRAETALAKLIGNVGIEKVKSVIAAAPTLNN